MAEKSQNYWIIFGKKPESKDLRDPKMFTELCRTENWPSIYPDLQDANKEFIEQGYKTLIVHVSTQGPLEPDETLEVKITKSYLKPSPEGTLGCDFEL